MKYSISFYRFSSSHRIHYRLNENKSLHSLETGKKFTSETYPLIRNNFTDKEISFFFAWAPNNKTFMKHLMTSCNREEVLRQVCTGLITQKCFSCDSLMKRKCYLFRKAMDKKSNKPIKELEPVKINYEIELLRHKETTNLFFGNTATGETISIPHGISYQAGENKAIKNCERIPFNSSLFKELEYSKKIIAYFNKNTNFKNIISKAGNAHAWQSILHRTIGCDKYCPFNCDECSFPFLEENMNYASLWAVNPVYICDDLSFSTLTYKKIKHSQNWVIQSCYSKINQESELADINCKVKVCDFSLNDTLLEINTKPNNR